jgi:hypothetical protein
MAPAEHVEPVRSGDSRDVHLDDKIPIVAAEAVRERKGRGLAGIAGVVIGKDMQPEQPRRRLECLDPARRQRHPYRHPEHLMRGQCRLDALSNAQLVLRIEQPHRSAADRINRRQRFLARVDCGIIDALCRLQASVTAGNRCDDCRILP